MSAEGAKRSNHSAGILAYRKRGAEIEVFLVHPGGPYWAARDDGAWSIPKGEYLPAEDALEAAQREFTEETGFAIEGPFEPLPPIRQRSGKWVRAWAVESADLEPAQLRSNDFTLEWPPRSGKRQQFPEVDRAAWFSLAQAEVKLIPAQRALLRSLRERVSRG